MISTNSRFTFHPSSMELDPKVKKKDVWNSNLKALVIYIAFQTLK